MYCIIVRGEAVRTNDALNLWHGPVFTQLKVPRWRPNAEVQVVH